MTLEEAIKTIQIAQAQVEWDYPMDYAEAFDMAISALEKQIPKKLIAEGDGYADGSMVYDSFYCPYCDHQMEEDKIEDYCPNCGQKNNMGGRVMSLDDAIKVYETMAAREWTNEVDPAQLVDWLKELRFRRQLDKVLDAYKDDLEGE